MERTGKRIVSIKVVLCILIGAALLLSLLPLLSIARYDLPTDDDLQSYELGTTKVWAETHSVGAVLKSAFDSTVTYYNTWQGTYFASFLMYLFPSVLPLSLYGWTPVIMLVALFASTLFIGYALIVRQLKRSRIDWLLISFTALFFQIQIMPSIKEGIFWLSSACLYLLSYCYLLSMFAFLQIARTAKSGFVRALTGVLAALSAFALAGGAFMLLIPIILSTAFILYRDIVGRDKRHIVQTSVLLLILLLGTILSTAAPGNQLRIVRENTQHAGSQLANILFSTIMSVKSGIVFVGKYSGFALFLFGGLCAATFYQTAKQSKGRFYSPILVFLATSALFCMQFFPTFYSVSNEGPARQENIVYLMLYWYYAVNILNLEGWLIRKYQADLWFADLKNTIEKQNAALVRFLRRAFLVVLAVLAFFALAQRESGLHANNSIMAFTEVQSGVAENHYKQLLIIQQGGSVTDMGKDSQILP